MKNFQILLVEDDPKIADTLVCALQSEFGSEAEVAATVTAEDALVCLNSEPFHLLISDHHLPQMTGLELIALTRASMPDLKIIFMTAAPPEPGAEKIDEYADRHLLKPFKIPELIGCIRGLMQAGQDRIGGERFR
ncbi:MAG: response regulator [Chloroflexi bacterium]|nr:response regulator [Chloroflexota bacterium]